MASYFDLPPQQKASESNMEQVPAEHKKQLGFTSVLSAAVTQLLDDLPEDESDSDSEEENISESENTKQVDEFTKKSDTQKLRQGKEIDEHQPTKSCLLPRKDERSPAKESAHSGSSPTRSGRSSKVQQPHVARFHSLRSMLFSNTIEGKMKQMTHEETEREEQAANKWKTQHEQRQMLSRPKAPETAGQDKGHGLGSRLKTSIRRVTSKEVPTMDTLKEDGAAHNFSDYGSTASSDAEPERYQWKPREADEESIDHSDVEDLVRWVSRRDPPSDGEARTPAIKFTTADDGHDSIGDSDVDELVRWASRKSAGLEPARDHHTGYSDVSTESDSEVLKEHDPSEDEDADDLVRWISHRDGPKAGPVHQARGKDADNVEAGSQVRHNSDVPEFNQWVKRGERTRAGTSTAFSSRDAPEEPERGRPLSREGRPKPKGYITHDDINDLVKWVSRKDSKQSPPQQDKNVDEVSST
ncbi:hypothetical protein BDU57DRAFT_106390 [Ampelomyces quisqualis]|uniref:Uncharacterized protein n=1 Tax=Ampelomyces quisqualis TaxID=50730 RepID=A0A6A5QAF5_AMPQU|nr:hypothetical protein BDU57DRAFT_106390 [Ampelomyces quisqualis]